MGLLGDLIVRLGVNTAQFTSGLSSAASSANTFSRNLANSFQNTANASTLAGNAVRVFSSQTSKGFKDVARIAQGIVVSQLFYQSVNSIRSATDALGEFSMQCEDARMSFGVLMKDQDKADRFMNTVQDFAARTPFTMQQSVDQARKLLAYGFKADNMSPIMGTLADASAASGDAQTFERVGRALGQIRTKGKMASQELLQLTEAGIPAFEILREKLHLTQAEMGKIGHLGISGDVAVNAILKGMQERYSGAAAAMAETTRGMLSTIKDNMLIIGSEATSPIYESFKNTIRKMRNALDEMRAVVRDGGIGGLMRQLIPAEIFPKIQILVANLINLKDNFSLLMQALAPFGAAVMEFIVNALNIAIPIINAFNRILFTLIYIAGQCSPFVRNLVGAIMGLLVVGLVIQLMANFIAVLKGLFIVRLIAQLIIGLAQAIRILSLAILSNPWIALLGVAAGALLYFGMASKGASGFIDKLGGGITKAFGTDPSKVFAPKMKENNEQAGEFNKNLTVSKDKLDNMGKAAKKAGQQAKDMLMSFDEVFNLKNPDEAGANPDAGDISDIGDIGSPTIPAIDVPEPNFPDLDNPIQTWVDTFKDTLIRKLKNTLIGAGIGALIGAIIGGLLGGPEGALIGAKIGALAGGIAGWFWDQLPDAFKNNIKNAGVGSLIGLTIGGVLGALIGQPAIGAGIGALVGGIAGFFWDSMPEAFKNSIKGAGIGATIGLVIGSLFGQPAIGAGVGALVGSIVGYFWDQMTSQIKDATKGVGIGAGIGAVIGGIMGGTAGAVIGAGIGALVGGIVGYFWDNLTKYFSGQADTFLGNVQKIWDEVYNTFSKAFKGDKNWAEIGGYIVWGILEGAAAAVITGLEALWDFLVKPIIDGIKNLFGIHSPATTMYPVGQYLVEGIFEGIKGAFAWFIESIASFGGQVVEAFKGWWNGLGSDITTWASETETTLQGWWDNVITGFGSWVDNTKTAISGWWDDTKLGFSTWYDSTSAVFSKWFTSIKEGFTGWFTDTKNGISSWATAAYNNIVTWATNSSNKISNWFTDTNSKFSSWWSDNKKGFDDWSSKIITSITKWFDDTSSKLKTWWSDNKTGFSTWCTDTVGSINKWATEVISKIGSWYNDTSTKFKTWWSEAKNGFSTFATDAVSNVTKFATDTLTKIGTWYSDTSSKFSTWWIDNKTGFSTWYTTVKGSVDSWYTDTFNKLSTWFTETSTKFATWWKDTKTGFSDWAKDCFEGVSDWFGDISDKIGKAIDKAKEFGKTKFSGGSSDDYDDDDDSYSYRSRGHARGGIFNKEHIANFAEGNKAEAIIPLENAGAMQPFVDSVAAGLTQSLGGILSASRNTDNQSQVDNRQIMYVGTLIADDSGLKELDRRMRVITIQENQRRGTNGD